MKLRTWFIMGLIGVLLFAITGTAAAASFIGDQEVYHLKADQVIRDDLYVGANEIIIDGTVEGDLFAAGSYVEINGTVTGDLFAAAAGVNISGVVADDARVAAASVEISGTIGDDLFIGAGGMAGGFSAPITLDNRSIAQGLFIRPATEVGGDLFVGAGAGQIAGHVAGDLYAGMGAVTLSAVVDGDAELGSDAITVTDEARVAGELRYASSQAQSLPSAVASKIVFEQIVAVESQPVSFWQTALSWTWRTVLILAGFLLLGWLGLRYMPQAIRGPAGVLRHETGKSAVTGLLAAVGLIFIPLVTILLIVLMAIFWGGFPAAVLGLALFSLLALTWIFSPLVTGYWLGRLVLPAQTPLVALLTGVAVVVILGRLPVLGGFVYLISFVLALGAILVHRMGRGGTPAPEKIPAEKVMPVPGD